MLIFLPLMGPVGGGALAGSFFLFKSDFQFFPHTRRELFQVLYGRVDPASLQTGDTLPRKAAFFGKLGLG